MTGLLHAWRGERPHQSDETMGIGGLVSLEELNARSEKACLPFLLFLSSVHMFYSLTSSNSRSNHA